MPDFTCTWWIDGWPWAQNLWRHCCIQHDLGASDEFLRSCVASTGAAATAVMAYVMYWGVKLFKRPYRWLRRVWPFKKRDLKRGGKS